MDDYNRRFGRAARNDHDAHRPLLERDCLDDIFTWQEQRRVTAQLTVHHKRTMYLLEPTEEAKAAAKKRVTVVEYEDGRVSIRFEGIALVARPFHKDGCVTQGTIVENKLLSGALTEIRKRQQQKEQELVRSAKSKREKRIVRDRFAGRTSLPQLLQTGRLAGSQDKQVSYLLPSVYPFRLSRSWILIVCLRLNRTIIMASPIADSAAATVRIKNTNTCPPRSPRKCEKAIKLKFTANSRF